MIIGFCLQVYKNVCDGGLVFVETTFNSSG